MPKSPHSALIAAYAAERGVPRRTAQDRFKKRHSDVMDWLARTGAKAFDPKAKPVEALALVERLDPPSPKSPYASAMAEAVSAPHPAALGKPAELRTPEEHAEVEAWLMFTANTAATRAAAGSNDLAAAGFARTAVECYKCFQQAKAERVRSEIESRRLLPVAEYEALCGDVQKIVNSWIALGPDLARALDPVNPSRVLRVYETFLQEKMNPLVSAILVA